MRVTVVGTVADRIATETSEEAGGDAIAATGTVTGILARAVGEIVTAIDSIAFAGEDRSKAGD